MYLRDRYSAFYLFAISADETDRKKRLMENSQKRLTITEINILDWNEYSEDGQNVYARRNESDLSEKEKSFIDYIKGRGKYGYGNKDLVRIEAYKKQIHQFILQDVKNCIENADIFLSNNGVEDDLNKKMEWEIVRNICLILYPGLVQPTPIERCMQIAFAAKANSGCLSRQVGAVVTDSKFRILSIGWNDVPEGDVPCSKKNLLDLSDVEDRGAYTHYELFDEDFRKRINKYKIRNPDLEPCLCGLPLRYCFKDIHKDGKDPMRSRAMHGEEKALDSCGRECEGGYLFTTSSPCEMCSKKAKDKHIHKIYYIEPYPGISEDQYSRSGDKDNIAKHILFTGAVGRAYTQMYSPIMPYKDILGFLGAEDCLGVKKK